MYVYNEAKQGHKLLKCVCIEKHMMMMMPVKTVLMGHYHPCLEMSIAASSAHDIKLILGWGGKTLAAEKGITYYIRNSGIISS